MTGERILPGIGLSAYWTAGSNGWNTLMDDNLRRISVLAQITVISQTTSLPGSPSNGDIYIVPHGAGSNPDNIALRDNGAWVYITPKTGWKAFIQDTGDTLTWSGSAWIESKFAQLGVNATPDATNKLSVNSAALLFNNVGNGVQAKINKNAAGDTASILFQTSFSGRAEMGTAGDDDFHFKVSADGSTWFEALKLARATGLVTLVGDPTSALHAATMQYVDTVGNAFIKADLNSVIFTKTGAGTVSIKASSRVGLAGKTYYFASATAVSMPTLTAGTDYAIYMCNDGTVRADANFSAPSGFSTSTSRKIGGFHYAPGGNSTGTTGGNTTPAINDCSMWDLKWKPSCPDPRGMTLVGGRFWCDIYLTNTAPETNGTSAYNLTIADGASPPKIPTMFGGNGSTAYSDYNWWEAAEVMSAAGKQLLSYDEFAAAMYGATEGASFGTDPGSTVLREAYTSKWGVMLSCGNMWVWGRDFSYWPGTGTAGYKANTGGRGSLYLANDTGVVAALFGGYWSSGSDAGSRSSGWVYYPWSSYGGVGSRGRCDHLQLV